MPPNLNGAHIFTFGNRFRKKNVCNLRSKIVDTSSLVRKFYTSQDTRRANQLDSQALLKAKYCPRVTAILCTPSCDLDR